ncbi:MAG TPA: hypothetical protein VGK62_01395 [Gaiellaceae bacterium]
MIGELGIADPNPPTALIVSHAVRAATDVSVLLRIEPLEPLAIRLDRSTFCGGELLVRLIYDDNGDGSATPFARRIDLVHLCHGVTVTPHPAQGSFPNTGPPSVAIPGTLSRMPSDPLQVEFIPAGPGSEIEARYSGGLGMLLFESQRAGDWPHGGTIDGILTLDLDADHVLVNADFMWPRPRWPRGKAMATLPTAQNGYFAARLSNLSSATLTTSPNVTPLLVGADLIIAWDTARPTQRVRLGPNVDALASNGRFVGLVIMSI